ncbi:hypothetical protein ACSBR1_021781 [Camellia fascicularis]
MKNDWLFQVIDEQIEIDGIVEEFTAVANIAKRCLIVKTEERPTMKKKAMELEGLINKKKKHPWVKIDLNGEESEHLLGGKLNGFELEVIGVVSSTVCELGLFVPDPILMIQYVDLLNLAVWIQGNKLCSSTLLYDLFLNTFSSDSSLRSATIADLRATHYLLSNTDSEEPVRRRPS